MITKVRKRNVTLKNTPITNYFCLLDSRTPKDSYENKEVEYLYSLSDILQSRKEKLKRNRFNIDVDFLDYNGCISYTPYTNSETDTNGFIITAFAMSVSDGINYDILKKVFISLRNWMIRTNQSVAMSSKFYESLNGNKKIITNLINEIFDNDECPELVLVHPMK